MSQFTQFARLAKGLGNIRVHTMIYSLCYGNAHIHINLVIYLVVAKILR